jgi:hypothetical protein
MIEPPVHASTLAVLEPIDADFLEIEDDPAKPKDVF